MKELIHILGFDRLASPDYTPEEREAAAQMLLVAAVGLTALILFS